MIRLRTGTVLEVSEPRPGIQELLVDVEGRREPALSYPGLTGPAAAGSRVLLNTTALEAGLGSGGYHFVVAVEGTASRDSDGPGHVMKLRYTPMQAKVLAVEEQESPDHEAVAGDGDLKGLPIAWLPLHSMVGAACAGAKAAGADRVVYVMSDGAALPVWLSRQVHALRGAGLLDEVITAGQALGGDRETVNLFSALVAARAVSRADVVVVADGPGKVGTGTTWGATEVSGGLALTVASILGGRPIAGVRLNFSDPGYRHYGLSPHSVTVLSRVAQAPVHVAVPVLDGPERDLVWSAIRDAGIEERHQVVEVTGDPGVDLLVERGVEMETMGRTRDDDPQFFLAAAAAGVLAGRMAAGSARWRAETPGMSRA